VHHKHSQAKATVLVLFSVSKSERRQRRNAGKVASRSFGIFCQPSLDKNQVKRLLQLSWCLLHLILFLLSSSSKKKHLLHNTTASAWP
jgi:hypothetical protein